MTRAALTALTLLLAACTAEGLDSTPAPTAEATATELTALPSAPTATRTPPPSFEELYDPKPYRPLGERMTPDSITRIPPPNIEAAEAEGPLWLGEHAYAGPLPVVFEGVEGSSELRCVEVGAASRVRSNDWVLDVSRWSAPDHIFELFPANPEVSHSILLRATRLEGEVATHVYEQWSGRSESNAGDISYRTSLILPYEGRWLLVATAGPQWGCFIVEAASPPPAYRAVSTVAEIERLGAEYPSVPPPEELPLGFHHWSMVRGEQKWIVIEGPAERRCVESAYDRRSGEWVFSPMSYGGRWRPELPGTKVTFSPLHQPADLRRLDHPLRVTATLLDDPRHTYVHVTAGNIYTLDPETNEPNFAGFVSAFVLPRTGQWAIVATGGPNWGCFLVTLSEPSP